MPLPFLSSRTLVARSLTAVGQEGGGRGPRRLPLMQGGRNPKPPTDVAMHVTMVTGR
jgi:hypothetical protein